MALPAPSATTTAVITGASSGLGAQFAEQLSALGYHVTVVARRRDRLDAVVAACSIAGRSGAIALAADLSSAEGRDAFLSELAAAGRRCSILINNAGFSTLGPVAEANRTAEVTMVATNCTAIVDLTTALLPAMVAGGGGAICNVASTAAFQPVPFQAGYGATKAFVLSYTEALAAEVAGRGVTVTALCPGPVETEFASVAGFTEDSVNLLPKAMWVEASAVVGAAIGGLRTGRRVVIPGRVNAIAARVARFIPRGPLTTVMARRHPGKK